MINRKIRDNIEKNNTFEEEIEIIKDYESLFFDITDSNTIEYAKEKRDKLFFLNSNVPQIIHKLTSN